MIAKPANKTATPSWPYPYINVILQESIDTSNQWFAESEKTTVLHLHGKKRENWFGTPGEEITKQQEQK